MTNSIDMSKYKGMFIAETNEHLQAINQLLVSLEKDSSNRELIEALFRSAHSIKGMAASMGYHQIADISHKMEDMMEFFRNDKARISSKEVDLLFEGLDALELLLQGIENDRQPEIDLSRLISSLSDFGKDNISPPETDRSAGTELESAQESIDEGEPSSDRPGSVSKLFHIDVQITEAAEIPGMRGYLVLKKLQEMGNIVDMKPELSSVISGDFGNRISIRLSTEKDAKEIRSRLESMIELGDFSVEKIPDAGAHPEPLPGDIPKEKPKPAPPPPASRTVRVNTDLLDNLINIVGEMVIARGRLFEVGRDIESPQLKEGIALMSNLIRSLHHQVMSVRMTPLESVMNRFPRLVRDIARKNGKQVELSIEGKTIELDRSIVDEMPDPLIHILRNSLDHGIETPEERKKAGKDPSGNLLIGAFREKDSVIINIKDDGRGMDCDKIKEIAIKRGVIKKDRANMMSDRDILMLVCHSGLSTAKTVTEVSGRGVGMDAVKNVIDSLSGKLEIDTVLGKGTSITIKLPLTVAIIQILLVKVGGNLFAIPINQVIRTVEVPKNELKLSQKQLAVLLEDELVSLLSLKKILGIKKTTPPSPYVSIVITEMKSKKVGLVVDCLYGQQEAFIKPLDPPLKWVKGLSGATILGDGSVVFLLDTSHLI